MQNNRKIDSPPPLLVHGGRWKPWQRNGKLFNVTVVSETAICLRRLFVLEPAGINADAGVGLDDSSLGTWK